MPTREPRLFDSAMLNTACLTAANTSVTTFPMRPGAIAAVGTLALIALFVVVAYPQLLCLLVSAACGLLLIGGFVAVPSLGVDKTITFRRTPVEEVAEILGHLTGPVVYPVLNGKPLRFHQAILTCNISIRLKNVPLLLAATLVAPAAIALAVSHAIGIFGLMDNGSAKYYAITGLAYCSVLLLIVAGLWMKERLLLRRSQVAIGILQLSPQESQAERLVRYSFTDPAGHYHGQILPDNRPHKEDNILLVLYDPVHPDTNQPFWNFWFHSIEASFAGQ